MAELRDPDLEGRDGVRIFVLLLILVAGMFFSSQWLFVSNKSTAVSPHVQSVAIAALKGATPAPGSMNIIERGLFIVLAFVHSHLVAGWAGSWGWAIVLLTVGINLLILPLRISSLRSGTKMQRIKPDIEAIKVRYKGVKLTDPLHNDMTAEIAKLHKDNGVNMASGCLPLLLQMPLLYAFFGMLRNAIALHGAEWLWLHDLSAADPLHILPILMVVFQLLVQLDTPSPGGDAKQQKTIVCVMTIAFGYVSWHYASGVALYALTTSIFSLVSQTVIDRSSSKREFKTIPSTSGHR